MVRIVQHREKCIGCHACVDAAGFRWRISRKDGKSTLIGGTEKRGWHVALADDDELEENLAAAKNCPVNIIRVEKIK